MAEISREIDAWAESHEFEDNLIGVYTAKEFEETFNYDSEQKMDSDIYWIKIF